MFHGSVLFNADAEVLEGECPHEPPSAIRKDGLKFLRRALGGTSVARPRASRRLPLPALRKPRHLMLKVERSIPIAH